MGIRKTLACSYKKAREWTAWLAGYLLFVLFLLILIVMLFFDAGIWANQTPLQLLSIVAALILLLRMDVAVSHEDLQSTVKSETETITKNVEGAATRIQNTQSTITEAILEQSANVKLVRETLSNAGKVLSLEAALLDLEPHFAAIKVGDKVEIDHLGLDMSQAWDGMCPTLRTLVQKANVTFRLLIMSENGRGAIEAQDTGGCPVPPVVRPWLGSGDAKRAEIEEALKELQADAVEAKAKGLNAGSLNFEVRSYRDIPVVHGIRIKSPFQAACVAISRWQGKNAKDFSWAGKEYHRIFGPASNEQRDLMLVLDGYFERWWVMNAPVQQRPAAAESG